VADASPQTTAPSIAAAVAGEAIQRLLAALVDAIGGEPWRLLPLAEAADRLGRSERWLRERVRRHEIAVVRLDGGALGFYLDDLIAFANERRAEARQ
jgi:hypothetical protein